VGINIDINSAIMAITTKSSINVNPFRLRISNTVFLMTFFVLLTDASLYVKRHIVSNIIPAIRSEFEHKVPKRIGYSDWERFFVDKKAVCL